MDKIKVLIIDDSALIRQFLSKILSGDDSIEVIGTAMDPIFAFSKIMKNKPDVITLDVEMPKMDGLTFLDKLMQSYPIPVVMISSQTTRGCETTMKAMELGAIDFITKPSRNICEKLDILGKEIIRKVKSAAKANLRVVKSAPIALNPKKELYRCEPDKVNNLRVLSKPKLIVIGASTGGVTAVKKLLMEIDARSVAVLLTLHMPAGFTTSFAANLNTSISFPVKEACSGDIITPGQIYIAPGNKNMLIEKVGSDLIVDIRNCEKEDIYKPSVNKTFISAAKSAGADTIAVILTGMGDDGARGMALLRQVGAYTIAQSKESSIIFGMPRRAIEIGAVREVLHLDEMSQRINSLIYG